MREAISSVLLFGDGSDDDGGADEELSSVGGGVHAMGVTRAGCVGRAMEKRREVGGRRCKTDAVGETKDGLTSGDAKATKVDAIVRAEKAGQSAGGTEVGKLA